MDGGEHMGWIDGSQDRWWMDRVRTGVKGWERGQVMDG